MNFTLLGYALSFIGIIYFLLVFSTTLYNFTKLPRYLQEHVEILLGREILILVISISYIVIYHIS